MSKYLDMDHSKTKLTDISAGDPAKRGAGPAPSFVPRPYPRRAPGDSPLRGRRVLVIDPDVARGRKTSALLSSRAAAARHSDGGPGLEQILDGRDRYEVILVHGSGVDDEDIDALQALDGGPSVVLIGDSARAESFDLTAIPEDPSDSDLIIGVARALESKSLSAENQALRNELDGRFSFGSILTRDPALRDVLRTLESVANTRATVLILGETGTGKSLLARTLHQASSRQTKPYVEVNCGALPGGLLEAELFGHAKGAFTGADSERPGRFEVADGGTIFLDEIDSAPPELQVKLLRVVQDRVFERVGESTTRKTDVRIVAATNASLVERVEEGTFREDLYWRLKVVEVKVPPLRTRSRDISPLAAAFVERFAKEYQKPIRGISQGALSILAAGTWPGNVRQLEHSLERAVLLAPTADSGVKRELLPTDLGQDVLEAATRGAGPQGTLPLGLEWLTDLTRVVPLKEALEGPERILIERALLRHEGRRDFAARDLGINRSTLFNKMRKYGLLDTDFATPQV